MKLLLVSTISWLCVNAQSLNPAPYSRQVVSPFDCGQDMGFYCADCNSMKFCANKVSDGLQVSCRDMDPATPYCDPRNHVCTSLDMCMGMPSDFICPARDTYPDVTDCKRYILCTAPNRLGAYYACMNNKIFDPATKKCVTRGTCVNYSNKDGLCRNSFRVIPHSNKALFVQCMGKDKPILRSCKDPYYNFNKNTMKCQFECQMEGLFADINNQHDFFQCDLGNNGRWIKTKFSCPWGQRFVSIYHGNGFCDYTFITGETSNTANVETQSTTSQRTGETSSTANVETQSTTSQVTGETNSSANVETTTTSSQVTGGTSSSANVEITTTSSQENVGPTSTTK